MLGLVRGAARQFRHRRRGPEFGLRGRDQPFIFRNHPLDDIRGNGLQSRGDGRVRSNNLVRYAEAVSDPLR